MAFVDANILLEVIEKRAQANICERMLGNSIEKVISILSLDLVMYFVEKDKITGEPVRAFLESFGWLSVTDAQWAFTHFKGEDFEDALQVACAIREGCNELATLNKALAKKYENVISIELLS